MRASYCRTFLACILLASAGPALAQSVKAGIEAWQRADYARALEIWRPLAEAGDPDAAFNLAQAYRLGRGVAVDLAVAQSWLERAALKDHVDAQTTLGLLLFQNGDRTGGLRWLKPAAEKGDPRAMLVYGTALFNGDSVAQDQVLGYAFVSRSAAQGLAPARDTLAQMDALIPLEQRKKGLAIATQRAKAAAKAATAKPKASKPAATAAIRRPAVAAPTIASSGGNWRIQLGAFSQRSSAEALFRRLSGSAPVAGRQQFLVPAGAVTRLQVGPFPSRAAAAAACSALAARGQACFPVGG
jgi:TPR repeat protein